MENTKDNTRAQRRAQLARAKTKARQVMKVWHHAASPAEGLDPRAVGRNASTHCRPCSCHLCRQHGPTIQERRASCAD